MSRRLLPLLCLLNAIASACQNRDETVKPLPDPRPPASGSAHGEAPAAAPSSTAVPATSAPAGASTAPPAAVSENIDELARFVQLPVRPAAAFWQHGRMGKNDHPDIPGPSDGFLVAVLSYAPADADRLVAAHSTPPSRTDIAMADWFPAGLRALAHPNADGLQVLSGTRYVVSYVRPPFSAGALNRVGSSGWFVLVLSTS